MTALTAAEATFRGARGREIFWRRWAPATPPRAVVVLAHGFGEHSGRYTHVAARLTDEGYVVVALDHHGHGRSAGRRALIDFDDAVADLDTLVGGAGEDAGGLPLVMLGHSMGGALALRYASAHGDRLAGLIVSGPLAEVEGRALEKTLGRVLGTAVPALPLAKLDPGLVSRDPAVVAAYRADPLVHHRPIPAGTVAAFLRHAETLPEAVTHVTVPTLVLYGTADGLCAPSGSKMVAERLGARDVTVRSYEGLYHEILNEPEQAQVLDDICAWLDERAPAQAVADPD